MRKPCLLSSFQLHASWASYEWPVIVDMENNRLCSMCVQQPASMYCSCSKSLVYLCDVCFLAHRNKAPGLIHTTVPVEVANIAGYQQRCQAFAEGREDLLQNLSRIDQCCAEFSNAVESLVTQIQQYRDQFLGQMQAWKSEFSGQIYDSIRETEASLTQEVVELKGKYSAALRNYTAGSLALFTFEVDCTQANACLSSIVKTQFLESKQPITPAQPPAAPLVQPAIAEIYWITDNSIQCFNARTLQLNSPVRLSSPVLIDGDNRWAVVDENQVLVCGGGSKKYAAPNVWKTALLLSKAGRVQVLPDMAYGHSGAGLIVRNGLALIFGSTIGPGGQQCEASKLTASGWATLPQMHKRRSGFTPAHWQSAMYLCGGMYNNTIEVFDGVTMRLLPFTLPEDSGCLACVKGDTLLVFTTSYLVTLWTSGDSPSVKQRQGGCYPYTLPVLWNDVVYSMFGGEVYKYSTESGNRIR